MQKLLDIINRLADKYKFDESEVKEVQEAVFALENGEDSLLNAEEDFKDPNQSDVDVGEDDGKED
jgi:hypothetical protein